MNNTSLFKAKYLTNLLDLKLTGNSVERLGTTLFNSKIKLTPHQIEAALFAFQNPLNKGCILADEVGLGKTIEAGIVLAQLWSEHKRKILIVAPASLLRQWSAELYDKFNLSSIIMDRKNYNQLKKDGFQNPFVQKNCIVLCSYQMCATFSDDIVLAGLDICVIDEAHKLRNVWTGKNVISTELKNTLSSTKKLLLTATPIQNGVMDLYGLSSIIDDNLFGDANIYKEKYMKNYEVHVDELKERLSSFTHRTLREEVQPYIKFTKRIPQTFYFEHTKEEQEIYDSIRELLLSSGDDSYLIPAKQRHLLLLILCKLMGSSIHSIVYTLEAMKQRLISISESGTETELDMLDDDDLIDDEEDIDEETIKVETEIDYQKLKSEINNLTTIIEKAKKIKIESKYIALRDAINNGFEHLRLNNCNEKILIFTESRRTQKYLYDSLLDDGYDEVLLFNGSNNDEISTKIYEEWCKKPENSEKLNNAKSINLRQAIIDYFKEKGKILIATEAGAEGLNIQFCSLLINYDLPWNPQVVEQRIGRCHRFGQEHDVVVMNFLNSKNVVEQRIFELLSSKFRVFNEIFGSSDSILGKLEDGTNLQNAIIDIYTKCRTIDEINAAFDKLQDEYKEEIDISLEKTKNDLLTNFDEDLQQYFAGVLDQANKTVSIAEANFWSLTKIILNEASFDDPHKKFIYKNKVYSLNQNDDSNSIFYNMNTYLGNYVMDEGRSIKEQFGHIDFDMTNYPYKITNISEIKGKKGYIILSKLTIDSFEEEDYLLFNGFLEDGTPLEIDTIEKLFRLDTFESTNDKLENIILEKLAADSKQHSNKVIIESEERNNKLFHDEVQRINKWAEDKIESTQLSVELMRSERRNLQKQSDLAENTYEKEKIEEQIIKLSNRIKKAWLELAEAEDEIEEKRKNMIEKVKKQMQKKNSLECIFAVSFRVI